MSISLNLPVDNTGIAANIETLAAAIAALPENTDLADNPLVHALLKGKGGYTLDPGLYARIFERAANLCHQSLEDHELSCCIEQVNGLRRETAWQAGAITACIEEILSLVQALPNNSLRRLRLLGLANYHAGLIYRRAGAYERAAHVQLISAGLSAQSGDLAAMYTSLFVSQQEHLAHEFMWGGRRTSCEYAYIGLKALYATFADKMDSNWREAQAPRDLVIAAFVLGIELKEMDQYINSISQSATALDVWQETMAALAAYRREDWAGAVITAGNNAHKYMMSPSSSTGDAFLFNSLIAIRALHQQGKDDPHMMINALRYPVNQGGGHWLRAAIERI